MRGQAAPEYAAVLLVALAMLAGAATWADGHALADEVHHAFARALCVARGGDCDADRRPCVTAADATRTTATLKLAFIRLDGGTALLRQTRSDGTVLITKGVLGGAGLIAGAGAMARLSAGGVRLLEGQGLEVSASALFARSQTWVVRGAAQADRLVALLKHRAGPGEAVASLPPPDMTTDRRGITATADALLRRARYGASLGLAATAVREVRTDRRTGQRTLVVERGGSAGLSLTAAELGVRAERDQLERYWVVADRDGRPLELVVWREGALQGSAALPPSLQSVAGLLSTATKGGRIWRRETHLDLTEPASLAVARGFLAQVTGGADLGPAARVEVTRALAARLDAAGIEHVTTLAVDGTQIGIGGSAGTGVRLGGSVERTTIHQRLLDAATRGIDGIWRRRADCVRVRALA